MLPANTSRSISGTWMVEMVMESPQGCWSRSCVLTQASNVQMNSLNCSLPVFRIRDLMCFCFFPLLVIMEQTGFKWIGLPVYVDRTTCLFLEMRRKNLQWLINSCSLDLTPSTFIRVQTYVNTVGVNTGDFSTQPWLLLLWLEQMLKMLWKTCLWVLNQFGQV